MNVSKYKMATKATVKKRASIVAPSNRKSKKRVAIRVRLEQNPDKIYGVRSSVVYTQIARTGRNPEENAEARTILIESLSKASKNCGRSRIQNDPVYVPMRASDIQICFGKRLDKLPSSTFVTVSED